MTMLGKIADAMVRASSQPMLSMPFSMLPGSLDFRVKEFVNDGKRVSFEVCLDVPGGEEMDLMLVEMVASQGEDSDCLQGKGVSDLLPTAHHVCHLCAIGRKLTNGKEFFPCPPKVSFVPANENLCHLMTANWAPELVPVVISPAPPRPELV